MRHGLLARGTLTLLVLVMVAGIGCYPLPFLSGRALLALASDPTPWHQAGLFAAGLAPFFLSALMLDLGTRLRPSWRTPPRKQATVWVIVIALLITVMAAHGIMHKAASVAPLPATEKALWLLLVVLGELSLYFLATSISRFGLGQGFALLLLLPLLFDIWSFLTTQPAFSIGTRLSPLIQALLCIGLTVWIARSPSRAPTSGLLPVVLAFALPLLSTSLAMLGILHASTAAAFIPGKPLFTALASLLTIALTLLLSRLFHATERSAIARTLVFLLFFILRPIFAPAFPVDPLTLVLTAAALHDLATEAKARHQWGPLHTITQTWDTAKADETAKKLRENGIPVLLRGEHFHTMTRGFGPLLPIEIMVPERRDQDPRGLSAPLEPPTSESLDRRQGSAQSALP